jgi:hypothetical protein
MEVILLSCLFTAQFKVLLWFSPGNSTVIGLASWIAWSLEGTDGRNCSLRIGERL